MNDINIRKKIKEPKYVTIYNILFKMITLGEFSKNDRLPSEPDLARDLGVSRTTLRQALTLLQEDELIKIIRGRGILLQKTVRLFPHDFGFKTSSCSSYR